MIFFLSQGVLHFLFLSHLASRFHCKISPPCLKSRFVIYRPVTIPLPASSFQMSLKSCTFFYAAAFFTAYRREYLFSLGFVPFLQFPTLLVNLQTTFCMTGQNVFVSMACSPSNFQSKILPGWRFLHLPLFFQYPTPSPLVFFPGSLALRLSCFFSCPRLSTGVRLNAPIFGEHAFLLPSPMFLLDNLDIANRVFVFFSSLPGCTRFHGHSGGFSAASFNKP